MKFIVAISSLEKVCIEDRADIYAAMVELFVDLNRQYLRRQRKAGLELSLYDSQIWYAESKEWQDAASVLETRRGDCKDLVAWRIAELREESVDARVHIVFIKHPDLDEFHIQVAIWDKGREVRFEDPSETLKSRRLTALKL